eukprot:6350567-Pyramimonas_sp.AAC.1
MRTDEGRRLALNDTKTFKGKRITLWGSMHCAGGSPWQYVNEAHYFRTGNHRAMRGLRGIRADFRYLVWNFREIARAVHKTGVPFALSGRLSVIIGEILRSKSS